MNRKNKKNIKKNFQKAPNAQKEQPKNIDFIVNNLLFYISIKITFFYR